RHYKNRRHQNGLFALNCDKNKRSCSYLEDTRNSSVDPRPGGVRCRRYNNRHEGYKGTPDHHSRQYLCPRRNGEYSTTASARHFDSDTDKESNGKGDD
ncbi:hypothetical protein PFISCL1PPCAC_14734, partial [Pristionchus fissidentatus]